MDEKLQVGPSPLSFNSPSAGSQLIMQSRFRNWFLVGFILMSTLLWHSGDWNTSKNSLIAHPEDKNFDWDKVHLSKLVGWDQGF